MTEAGPYYICRANQWTGLYVIGTSIMKELNRISVFRILSIIYDDVESLIIVAWLASKYATDTLPFDEARRHIHYKSNTKILYFCILLSLILLPVINQDIRNVGQINTFEESSFKRKNIYWNFFEAVAKHKTGRRKNVYSRVFT